jgi:hypothetical protein
MTVHRIGLYVIPDLIGLTEHDTYVIPDLIGDLRRK